MKTIYEVTFKDENIDNVIRPWVVAESITEAEKKGREWLNKRIKNHNSKSYETMSVVVQGNIDVE